MEEARRYALIAFDLARRFGGETWLCRISTQLYGMVNIWVKPMPYCLERLKHAYQVGLGGGDVEYAMVRWKSGVALTQSWLYDAATLALTQGWLYDAATHLHCIRLVSFPAKC